MSAVAIGSRVVQHAKRLITVVALFALSAASGLSADVAQVEPNVLRWATATEKDNFGYDVYRGLSETGPFQRINSEMIPGAGTTDLPQRYEYVDTSIEPDTVYWYYIESISLNGERKRMTPIYPSPPKAFSTN